eukprot:GHVL01013103.1.p1 GENE.GHVL01013103.1~~GHVL01013103.1.p1  ORF type:complete len:218 (-),score=34.15 GHVL01013103.1:1205-1858(-)
MTSVKKNQRRHTVTALLNKSYVPERVVWTPGTIRWDLPDEIDSEKKERRRWRGCFKSQKSSSSDSEEVSPAQCPSPWLETPLKAPMNRNIHTTRTGGFAMLTKAFPDASSSQLFSEENCQIRRARSDPEEIRNLLPGGVVRTCLRCGQRPIDEQGFMDGVPGLPQPLCRRCKRFQILRIGWPLYKYRYKIHTVTPNRRIKISGLLYTNIGSIIRKNM